MSTSVWEYIIVSEFRKAEMNVHRRGFVRASDKPQATRRAERILGLSELQRQGLTLIVQRFGAGGELRAEDAE